MAVADDLIELARIKEQIASLGEEKNEVEEKIISTLMAAGAKSVANGDIRGALVESSVIEIDADALQKKLTAAQWKKVTKPVLDKERLEAEIVVGNIDRNVVAGVSTEKDRKPYIKVTGKLARSKPKPPTKTATVNTKNSAGGTKPAAKRVRRPAAKP